MHGTASTVRAFLLVEAPGSWGVDALRDARMAGNPAAAELTELVRQARAYDVRVLLIRRHGRAEVASGPAASHVFAAYADPHRPWLESLLLDNRGDRLDVDLGALARGQSSGLIPTDEHLFLTCTHGRHDRCCAERGRPVAAALDRSHPDQAWEVSHIGGDRFAGNLLVLPDGLYYGRVEPESADRLASRHLAGHLDLAHLRGRCGYGFAVQSAEWFLRCELRVTARSAVTLLTRTQRAGLTTATFVLETGQWRVVVRRSQGPVQQLTCRTSQRGPTPVHALVSIEPG